MRRLLLAALLLSASCTKDISGLRNTCDHMELRPDTVYNKVPGGSPPYIITQRPYCPKN